MSSWLEPLRRSLDRASDPVTFFFRDDDIGWSDERLCSVLDLFADHGLPIDLAVIPEALTPRLAGALVARVTAPGQTIALHQHGFAHVNHELLGRKCEFGPTRRREQQLRDIANGRQRLRELLGPLVQPIFTPPWNRCTAETGECLLELGFRVLSRDVSAGKLALPGLCEIPVGFDWFAKRKGQPLNRHELGELLAARVDAAEPVGVMFHHALMDADELRAAGELLALLTAHPRVCCRTMRTLVPDGV